MMKKKNRKLNTNVLITLLSAALLSWNGTAVAANEQYLVKDGVALGRIYLPQTFGTTTMLAAEELQTYIGRMTGAEIMIQYAPFDELRRKQIRETAIILEPAALGLAGEGVADRDSFEIVSEQFQITIKAASETGVLFGVYSWLDSLGVRWFAPGELGESVPQRDNIPIVPGSVVGKPAYWSRSLWYNGDAFWHFKKSDRYEQDFNDWWRWCLRNRLDLLGEKRISQFHGVAQVQSHNQHYIATAALQGVDIKEEPERFALYREGKPSKQFPNAVKTADGYRIATDNICMTHPDNIAQATEHAVEYLKARPHLMIAPMALGDFSGVCQCDRCWEANGGVDPLLDPNQVVWLFMNQVSRQVAEVLPGKGIGFYACYGGMTRPPKGLKGAPTALAVVTHVACNAHGITAEDCPYNQILLGHLGAIQTTGSRILARAYTMWYGRFQPLAILDSIRGFHAKGVGAYTCELMGRDELRNITHWCMARLLWDPSKEPQELIEEYTSAYYGAAGLEVGKILTLIDKQVRDDHYIVFDTYFDMLTPELVGRLRQLATTAQDKVSGREAERFSAFNLSLEMLLRRAEVNRALTVVNEERTAESVEQAKQMFLAFASWVEEEDILDTCSPQLLGAMGNVTERLDKFVLPITPVARPDIAEGGVEARLDALYTNVAKPAQLPEITLLPELWRFRNDLDRVGEKNGWQQQDFDDSQWHQLNVYNFIEGQDMTHSAPHFWYRTRFTAPVIPEGQRAFMRIGGLDDGGTIYINGQIVYQRLHLNPNDWKTSFEFDITEAVEPGKENTIAIHGINHMGAGGLWRGVGIYVRN